VDKSTSGLNLSTIRSGIKLPPELEEMYQRVVIAGMKVMFSDESHHLLEKELQGPGTTEEKLGRGLAGLMLLLFKQSNKTLPPQVIIPAGIELMMNAVEYFQKTDKVKISDQDIGHAIQIMLGVLMHAFGAQPNEVFGKAAALSQGQGQGQGQGQSKPLIAQQMNSQTQGAAAPSAVSAPSAPSPAMSPQQPQQLVGA
jgi:hypothetical protein